MIAGGCEAPITPLSFAGFCNLMAMNTGYNAEDGKDPTKASRPFDLNRGMNGMACWNVSVDTVHSLKKLSLSSLFSLMPLKPINPF
jgi:hypothetical protein